MLTRLIQARQKTLNPKPYTLNPEPWALHLKPQNLIFHHRIEKSQMMKHIIKSEIHHDGEYYCGRCLDFDIFSQGKTLDELVQNLKEAIQLHFEDDDHTSADFVPNPSLFTMMDLGEINV
jgi:predicted RNase H-like HicB family nuclease